MVKLVITKKDANFCIEQEKDSATLSIGFQDTMDYRENMISLTREEILEVIEVLEKMV